VTAYRADAALVPAVAPRGWGRRLLLAILPGHVFQKHQWYRRLHGGHWERWFCEPAGSWFWFHQGEGCVDDDVHGRRPVACWYRNACEDWP